MPSQKSTQAANVTTAADELGRFARYVEFKTRDFRETVTTYLGTNKPSTAARREEDDEDGFFDDAVRVPSDEWVEVTEYAIDYAPEDHSQQIYHPTPPPGPIAQTYQQTSLATHRAALQALGLTGTYLELALRLVAEDVGWLTHTATFEDAVRKVRERWPMLGRMGESYGRGARRERERRGEKRQRLIEWRENGDGGGRVDAAPARRLTREEQGRFGPMEEV